MSREKGKVGSGPFHGKKQAAHLLEALEALRMELGNVGEDIITIMREAGVTPPEEAGPEESSVPET